MLSVGLDMVKKNIKIGMAVLKPGIGEKQEENAIQYLDSLQEIHTDVFVVAVTTMLELPLVTQELLAKGCDAVLVFGSCPLIDLRPVYEKHLIQISLRTQKPILNGLFFGKTAPSNYEKQGSILAEESLALMNLLKDLKQIKKIRVSSTKKKKKKLFKK